MKGTVVKSTGTWCQVLTEEGELLSARLKGKLKLIDKKITNPVTIGDLVVIDHVEEDFIISSICDRKNYVIRTSPRKKGHGHLLAANIDQAIVIASLRQPRTSVGFIDRFLITLETFRIPGVIIFNKSDIYNSDELAQLGEISEMYQSIGYETIITSFEKEPVHPLERLLEDKRTLLCGHSGTGKSTLINKLFPEADQAVKGISSFADKGVHTTTFGQMFTKEDRYSLIDTPGIKELGLAEVQAEELSHYFPEMRAYLGQCKFHNCQHINEPGCRVKEAFATGEISESRFDSYLSMLFPDDNRR
ncbi:MAG: ribosome biogenesis GTPase [Cyclobacteriaceae bacterium]|jgi:ribosome biogenesis GTPase